MVGGASRKLTGVAAVVAALSLPTAATADSLPWSYAGGSFNYGSNRSFTLQVENLSSSPQTVQYFNTQHTVPAAGVVQLVAITCSSGPCPAILDFSASSPDIAPFATAGLDVDGFVTPIYIGPGQFRVVGPGGSVDQAVSTIAASNSSAFGSLQTTSNALQSLLAAVPSSVKAIQSSLGSSPLAAQLQPLNAKIDKLSAQVAALTKALAGKPAAKRKRKRKHA